MYEIRVCGCDANRLPTNCSISINGLIRITFYPEFISITVVKSKLTIGYHNHLRGDAEFCRRYCFVYKNIDFYVRLNSKILMTGRNYAISNTYNISMRIIKSPFDVYGLEPLFDDTIINIRKMPAISTAICLFIHHVSKYLPMEIIALILQYVLPKKWKLKRSNWIDDLIIRE